MTATAFRAAWRLTLRSYWIWSVTGLVLFVLFVLTRLGEGVGHLLSLVHMPAIFPFFFLGQMLATVYDAQQERTAGVQELLESLPYRPVPVLLGRLGAVYSLWLAAGTAVYLAGVFMAVLLKGHSPVWFLLLDWALLVPVTLLFTTAAAFAVGRYLGRGFAPYLAVLVLFLVIAVPQLASEILRNALGSGPTTILDVTLSAYFSLSVTPFYPDWLPLLYNRLMASTAAIAIVALLIWRLAARRRESSVRPAGLVVTAAVLAAAVILTGNRAVWATRTAQMMVEESGYRSGLPRSAVNLGAPAVAGYDVALHFETDRYGLGAVAKLNLPSPGETAAFTLQRSLTITGLLGPDGQPRPFTRNGDVVLVETRGESGVYTFTYQGSIVQWRQDMTGGLRLAAHVYDRSVMLPTSLGWYPLPGMHTLAYRGTEAGVLDAGISHPAAPFRLNVTGLGDLTVISNTQHGDPVSGAWLVASPWERRPVAEGRPTPFRMETAVAPGNLINARHLAGQYADELAFYANLVPLQEPLWLIEVPDSLWVAREHIPATGYPGAMILPAGDLARLDNMVIHAHMLNWWWSDPRTREEQEIHDVLTLFMAELYMRVVRGTPRAYITMIRRTGTETPVGKQTLKQLHTFYDSQGAEAIGTLLRQWHRPAEPLTWQQVTAALEGR